MVVLRHIPWLRSRNQPLEKTGRRGAAFINVRVPNPESAVPVEVGVRHKAEQAALIIGFGVGIAERGKTGNMAPESSDLSAKVEKEFRRAVAGEALAIKLSR